MEILKYLSWIVIASSLSFLEFAGAAAPYSNPCLADEGKLKDKREKLEECIGEIYTEQTPKEQIRKCQSDFELYIKQTHALKACRDNANLWKEKK